VGCRSQWKRSQWAFDHRVEIETAGAPGSTGEQDLIFPVKGNKQFHADKNEERRKSVWRIGIRCERNPALKPRQLAMVDFGRPFRLRCCLDAQTRKHGRPRRKRDSRSALPNRRLNPAVSGSSSSAGICRQAAVRERLREHWVLAALGACVLLIALTGTVRLLAASAPV